MSELNDIVAIGLDLKPKTLLSAYREGVFPWPSPGLPLLWYSPQERAVLDLKNLHVGKRLHSYLKKASWTYTVDQAFTQVIEACKERGSEGTWITDEMTEAYIEMHKLGHAHSVEVWEGSTLIGGLYGMDVAGTFSGESMFHRKDNASKAAILFVCSLLKNVGREFMDIQVLTPHMEAFGAHTLSRGVFRKRLKAIQEKAKTLGPSTPFEKGEARSYCDFSMFIV